MTLFRHVARLVTLALLFVGLGGCSVLGSDTTTIKVELATSSGLFEGNDVGVLGVPVGEVTDIDPQGGKVVVTLEVDADVKIPADAGAVVVSRSMATDRYVELTPVYDGGPTMESGHVIAENDTRTPVEWDTLLKAVDTLADGLNGKNKDGKPLKKLLDQTAATFDGNGKTVRETITNLVAGTGVFAEHRESFANTLTHLDTLTGEIAKNQRLARRFIKNIAATTNLVRDERLNLEEAVDSISETISLLAIFVRHHKDDLSDTATNIEDVSERILKHRDSLSETLRVMPVAMENLGRAINDRNRLDVKLPPTMLLPGSDLIQALCGTLPRAVCDALGTDPDLGAIIEALLGLGGRP